MKASDSFVLSLAACSIAGLGQPLVIAFAQNAKGEIMKTQTTKKTGASQVNAKTNNRGRTHFTVYLAGDLWTHKDLVGNALLAEYIDTVSDGRYQCVLPQDLEVAVNRDVDIRNVDLKHVMSSDMAIFNFDGANLDAGTVVEFIYAKMLDIPCVIFRTDFRSAGEGNKDQNPWNLMAAHWPRSRVVVLNGMAEYQGARDVKTLSKTLDRLYKKLAAQLIENLDEVRIEKPLIDDRARLASLYDWAVKCPGAGYGDLFGHREVERLISGKLQKGLLAVDHAKLFE